MSLQSGAIIPRHVTTGEICVELRKLADVTGVGARQMTRPEYQLIEFQRSGRRQAIHAFLASYAADDYADVVTGPSTLLTIEASAENAAVLAQLAGPGGWIRVIDADAWQPIG